MQKKIKIRRPDFIEMRFSYIILIFILFSAKANSACNIVNGKAYGDCENVNINQGSKPILEVHDLVIENGIIEGANVHDGGTLYFSGINRGVIKVYEKGKLDISGTSYKIINNGGEVIINGSVDNVYCKGGRVTVEGIVNHMNGDCIKDFKYGSVVNGNPN